MTTPNTGPDPILPGKAPESPNLSSASGQPTRSFDSYMNSSQLPGKSGAPSMGSPMEIGQGSSVANNEVSYNSLLAQASQAQDTLGTVGAQLKHKSLKLDRSQTHLVRQKLSDAKGYIRTAGAKLGLDLPEGEIPPGASPIARFIAMINDGQDQLAQVQQQLHKLSTQQGAINPGEMMSIQVKMGLAQQEISYTSTLLGKVIQSITQLLNTQL